MESEVTMLSLIRLKADCSDFVFRAEAIEHILIFAKKEEKNKKQKNKIKKTKDALKAAPLPAAEIFKS